MTSKIPIEIVKSFRDRRALLWVCQRYDLLPNEEPHRYDLPANEASLRYRTEPQDIDFELANLYWEAIWLEGAKSPLLAAVRKKAEEQPSSKRRSVVVLATENDAHAEVSSLEFLPTSVLPGLIDEDTVKEAQYGFLRERARERVAWELAGRMMAYQGRALVVIGCEDKEDIDRLYEVLEDRRWIDQHVILVWPENLDPPIAPDNPGINLLVWHGYLHHLVQELMEIGAPRAEELPRWSIRIRQKVIELTAADIHRVGRRFKILTENDLIPPEMFVIEDLHDFLKGSLDNWAAFGVGLPVKRSYTSEKRLSMWEELKKALEFLDGAESDRMTFTLKLPCEGGSGATTLIRSVAHQAAEEGYPTLILKPEQVEVDFEDLLAFTTALADTSLSAGETNIPPLLIVSDTEHANNVGLRNLPRLVSAHGRRAVFLQAIPLEDSADGKERRSPNWVMLSPLRAKAEKQEINNCQTVFESITRKWKLAIETQSIEQWENYSRATQWLEPVEQEESSSLFWVALRFFLIEGMDFTEAEKAKDAMGNWISRRLDKVKDPGMKEILLYIAVLSSLRMSSPMWTVLRPITGGIFSTQFLETFRQLKDVVEWRSERIDDLNDQVMRFHHPSLAEEFLRTQGVRTQEEKANILKPVLSAMSAGHLADIYVMETYVVHQCAPKYEERSTIEKWRLNIFDSFPPLIRDQSSTVLHHWARCLYHFADPENSNSADLSNPNRRALFEAAIKKLDSSTKLAERPEKGEHPGHVYNTLGTAYSRYADFLASINDEDGATKAWSDACISFEKSMALMPGENVEALLAFGTRLYRHAAKEAEKIKEATDIAKALTLFDEAEEILDDYTNPDPTWFDNLTLYRSYALDWISKQDSQTYIEQLKNSDNPALGYYCEARLHMKDFKDDVGLDQALQILEEAYQKDVELGPRGLILYIMLIRKHAYQRYDFKKLNSLYQNLERATGYVSRPIDLFRHAVICYQLGGYREGADRFRKLRERLRRLNGRTIRVRDFWRNAGDPSEARITHIKVLQRITEWRAEGYVDDLKQNVRLRPRHFSPPPKEGEIVRCAIRFEASGPLAVPPRFEIPSKKQADGHLNSSARRPN